MQPDITQNQILSFFTPEESTDSGFDYLNFLSDDSYNIFIIASLSSQNVENIRQYLHSGIQELQKQFDNADLPILDRMKESIYRAGDHLVSELQNLNLPLEDVDFSTAVLAFKEDVLYVWIDGGLNVRIYREKDSMLVNKQNESQFYGSMNVRLGDIIAVSFSQNIELEDNYFEDYVLEKKAPLYPSLYLDYQVDLQGMGIQKDLLEELPEQEVSQSKQYEDLTSKLSSERESLQQNEKHNLENDPELQTAIRLSGEYSEYTDPVNAYPKEEKGGRQIPAILKNHVKPVVSFLHTKVLALTSQIITLFYTKVLRKNERQLKRFNNSGNKKIFQYVLIVLILVLVAYLIFFRGVISKKGTGNPNTTSSTKNEAQTRAEIQSELDRVVQNYNAVDLESFDSSITTLRNHISDVRGNNFKDQNYLDSTLSQAQNYEDTLYKITPITKVDGIVMASQITNASILDFDVVGNDIYAVDQENSQILRSNSNQQFETFASSEDLRKLSKISCTETLCYLLDEDSGLASLNLSTKKFNIFKGFSSAGKDVKEMIYIFDSIYTLVPSEGKVLKYAKIGEDFKAPVQWNQSEGFGPDTQDFSIDGNVFELSSKGELKKYFNGKFDPSFKGLDNTIPAPGSHLQMALTPARQTGTNRLYIADSDKSRIAVYEKDLNPNSKYSFKGNYKYRGPEQIKFDSFDESILSKDEKYLYLLENNSVYKINVTAI